MRWAANPSLRDTNSLFRIILSFSISNRCTNNLRNFTGLCNRCSRCNNTKCLHNICSSTTSQDLNLFHLLNSNSSLPTRCANPATPVLGHPRRLYLKCTSPNSKWVCLQARWTLTCTQGSSRCSRHLLIRRSTFTRDHPPWTSRMCRDLHHRTIAEFVFSIKV